jgi:hypothetical protein
MEEEIAEAHKQREGAEVIADLLEDEALCMREELQMLEADMNKAAHEHGLELLRVYETIARLEAAVGEQGLEVQRLENEVSAANRRCASAESAAAAARNSGETQLQRQELNKAAVALVEKWNTMMRGSEATLPSSNLAAALTTLRDSLTKEKANAGSARMCLVCGVSFCMRAMEFGFLGGRLL